MISDKKRYFMESKEKDPYEVFFINESSFQELLLDVVTNNTEKKISVIGYITENNLNEAEAIIKYDNSLLKIDISRIVNNYKISNCPYFLYGSLKKKNNEAILYVNFYRITTNDFDFLQYKDIINYQRSIIQELKLIS